jgi:hypothetical protein
MKRLVAALAVISVLMALVVTGCTNKGLVGTVPEEAVSSCVTCHTDKALLQELAVTEEEAVSEETTGEG